ncbi:MAG: ABC transporter [Sporolactobacillus sp.]
MIIRQLENIYNDWESKLGKNEWYFSDEFDLITKNMTPFQAFSYMPNVISALLELQDKDLIWETLDLLSDLYSIADTAEIHPFLKDNWNILEEHIHNYKEVYDTPFQELKGMLRIKS